MANCCATEENQLNNVTEQVPNCCSSTNNQSATTSLEQDMARCTNSLISNCPSCGQKGKKVGVETVKAMLAVTLHEIRLDCVYLFCRTAGCSVVYFADDGAQTFCEEQLREKVYQKHPDDDDRFVCYCFRHTLSSIRKELLETGQSTVIETVTAGTKIHQCACEIRNPQGSCCLGNVRAAVKHVQQEVGVVVLV